ncbi:MAG: hypothetical protein WKF47_01615 [Geodermatophilaceae bacterium]
MATTRRRLLSVTSRMSDAVERDPAAGDVVQARDQGGERGLAAAGGADQGDGLPGCDGRGPRRCRTSCSPPG